MLIGRLISLWYQSFWRRFFARRTQYLGYCLLAAYSTYLVCLGSRPIVVVSGALLCILTLLYWLLDSRTFVEQQDHNNLLDKTIFHARLLEVLSPFPHDARSKEAVPTDCQTQRAWQKQYDQVEEIHQIAIAIAHQAPLFIPDLLDTLHTVVALLSQFTQVVLATQQLKTLQYQKIAQQQLLTSTYRLNQTHRQLQELHDQLVTEGMDMSSPELSSGVSSRLQTLITSNKSELAADQPVY